MKKKIHISEKFPMADWPQMDSFIAATHGSNHVLRNRPLFDWFFLRNANKDEANLVVAYEGGKLISLLGYIPTKFIWGGEVIEGTWMAHWITLKEYRSGIGALLMKKMTEMFPIVAGQGASMMNKEIVTQMRFRFLERIPKVVCILNSEKVAKLFQFQIGDKEIALVDEDGESPVEVRALKKESFDPDWGCYPSMKYGTLRDREYLTSRYIDYPFFKYHVFIEGAATTPAVCVVRLIDTKEGIRVARMLEFFFPENDSGKRHALALIRKCLTFFKLHNCDYTDFYCTSQVYLGLLMDAGFIKEEEGALPSLLDPVDMSRKYQNMELWVSPALRNGYPGCENEFMVMRADGDQDRPNESYRYTENE